MNDNFSNYSDEEAHRIARLVFAFMQGTITKKEHDELDEWVAASDENMELFERLTDEKNIEEAMKWMQSVETEKTLQKKKEQIVFNRPKRTIRFWQYAVAASVIIVAGIFIYKYRDSNNEKKNNVVATNSSDIQPGSDKAILKMGNGKMIVLDNAKPDTSVNEQIKIFGQKGEVVYNNDGAIKELEYHELTIPRKGKYKLSLPDGTTVWLNSESSIKFPTAFVGKERKIFVTGEAFFEVAKNKEKPFIAIAGDISVEALGTQFNVNTYKNEPVGSATLVQGSVLVSSGKNENILKPGQQAQITTNGFKVVETDATNAIAWKNDQFKFTNTPIDVIMRQIERWYDAETVWQDKVDFHFNGTIDRSVPVSKLLRYMEKTGQVHFRIEGKKIIVMK
jgi:ferric-dicitrate binding protein FerR (iron transport regulator)